MKKKIVLLLLSISLLQAGDVMVERMQSVVDEVTELRKRYEDAVHKNKIYLERINEQESLLLKKGKGSSSVEHIKDLEFENKKLKQTHKMAKQQVQKVKELENELEGLQKDNSRLNASALILVEKNHSLLEQITKLKRTPTKTESVPVPLDTNSEVLNKEIKQLQAVIEKSKKTEVGLFSQSKKSDKDLAQARKNNAFLKKENKAFKQELVLKEKDLKNLKENNKTKCEPSKQKKITKGSSCKDDNPFPTLLKKEVKGEIKEKEIIKKKKAPAKIENVTSGVYRVKGENAIYSGMDSDVVEIWEDKRSFTSNVRQGEWIKITGFFINRKWKKAETPLWIKKENTVSR